MTKILVIEDETLIREEVMEWLALEGYEVLGAADGVEGVNLAVTQFPDVILCDIAMPRLDGYGVMLDIRANSLTEMTPFIYMTAKSTQEDVRRGMALGADDYITKPFTYQQLIRAIKARLQRKALEEKHQQNEIEQWRQALAEEHELRQLKSKMVGMFSHDFRNPLASILSSSGILRNYSDRLDEQRRLTYLNRIDGSVYQLIQMLDDMLTVAQMESGNFEFKPVLLNMAEFLQQIVEEFQLINGETHLLIYTSETTESIMADPRLLRQIVTNLISNALKYSPKGGTVNISLQCKDKHIEIVVQDHGIGIPETDLPRMFNAFQRASNVSGVSGTGLGLAIVKQAVDLHGGTVDLESEVDVGTKFTVKLPVLL
jgi:signal transduction histidine kinase